MLRMRNYTEADRIRIEGWPVYPVEYAELDYALRANGWIDEFAGKPATDIHVFALDGELVAYTILAGTSAGDAEFRIALHGGHLGKGLGMQVSILTITRGFAVNQLRRIHLIVRKNNYRAKHLYEKIGFDYSGERVKMTNGKQVSYQEMELRPDTFRMSRL